ncbi:MAG: hypothetical protein QXI58_00825 [Candidatus Micrarchaeia archaeon]
MDDLKDYLESLKSELIENAKYAQLGALGRFFGSIGKGIGGFFSRLFTRGAARAATTRAAAIAATTRAAAIAPAGATHRGLGEILKSYFLGFPHMFGEIGKKPFSELMARYGPQALTLAGLGGLGIGLLIPRRKTYVIEKTSEHLNNLKKDIIKKAKAKRSRKAKRTISILKALADKS